MALASIVDFYDYILVAAVLDNPAEGAIEAIGYCPMIEGPLNSELVSLGTDRHGMLLHSDCSCGYR